MKNPLVYNGYDLFMYFPAYKIRQQVLKLCEENGYKKIIDLSCGTGYQIKMLKDSGFDAVGVDIDPKMLDKANTDGENCINMDSGNTGFPDKSFDLVMSSFAIHEKDIDKQKQVIAEMQGLVKDNGTILIVDFEFGEFSSFYGRLMIRAIERMAGGEHYKNFKSYIETGGLDALLKNEPLECIDKHYFAMRAIVLSLYRKLQK